MYLCLIKSKLDFQLNHILLVQHVQYEASLYGMALPTCNGLI